MSYLLDAVVQWAIGAVVSFVLGWGFTRVPSVRENLLQKSSARVAVVASLSTALIASLCFTFYIYYLRNQEILFLTELKVAATNSLNEARIASDAGSPANKNWFNCGRHSTIALQWAQTTQGQVSTRADTLLNRLAP